MAEGRTIVTMTPTAWVTWDYNKGRLTDRELKRMTQA